MTNRTRALFLVVATALAIEPGADAAAQPNVTGLVTLTPSAVAPNVAASFDARMCNVGSTSVGTVFLGTFIPTTLSYSVTTPAKGGICKAVRYGTSNYVYCPTTLVAGECTDLVLSVKGSTRGTYTLSLVADSSNLLRESNEKDNAASATLTIR